jgi:hypothetical protein
MDINMNEAKIIKAALNALQAGARSDEPHYAHTEEFDALRRKVTHYLD